MTSDLWTVVLVVAVCSPLLLILVANLWSAWWSPEARARGKAYELGYARGLEGATYEDSPFEASVLVAGFQDGVHDARLTLRRRRDKEAFQKEWSKLRR